MIQINHMKQTGSTLLGFGNSTIGGAGCLMLCFGMAANALGGFAYTPRVLNDTLKAAHAFSGSALIRDRAARTLGMLLEVKTPLNARELVAAVSAGTLVIVGVDYKKGRSSGRSNADHFVLAYAVGADGIIVFADPATGADGYLTVRSDGSVSGQVFGKPCRAVEGTFLAPAPT